MLWLLRFYSLVIASVVSEPSISISLSLPLCAELRFRILIFRASSRGLSIPEKPREAKKKKRERKRGGKGTKVNEENRLLSGGKPLGGLSIIYKGEPLERESSSRKTRRNEATSFLRGCNATGHLWHFPDFPYNPRSIEFPNPNSL